MSEINIEPECWLPVVGYEGLYEVSDYGRVRALPRTVVVSGSAGRKGYERQQSLHVMTLKYCNRSGEDGTPYYRITLTESDGSTAAYYVHTMVLNAFTGSRAPGFECRHKNGRSTDNRLANLEWATPSVNNLDRTAHGTNHNVVKERCPRGHTLATPNLMPTRLLRCERICLACSRASADLSRARKRGASFDFQAASDLRYAVIMDFQVSQ